MQSVGLSPAIVIPNYVWSLYLTGLEPGIRCLGMCHADDVVQYYRPLSWYEPAITKFVAVSNECHDRLSEYVPFRSADIAMLPYGVRVPASLERRHQTKPLRLIYAGRVTQPQKRVWDFVPLVEHLLRAKVPFVFDIVGEGDEFEPLAQVMRARIPAADVHFHGACRTPRWPPNGSRTTSFSRSPTSKAPASACWKRWPTASCRSLPQQAAASPG